MQGNPAPPPRTALRELREQLEDVEAKVAGAPRLWQREWAAMAVRGARIELDRIKDEDPGLAAEVAKQRARWEAVHDRLLALDREEIGPLEERFRRGAYAPSDLMAELERRPRYEWDAFVQRLLGIDEVPRAEAVRAEHMNKYQPTPLAVILDLVSVLRPDDVLYDLGAGLGKVTLSTAWLSPALARGVELDPAYCRIAEQRARELGLTRAEMINADVREVDYSPGTCFYFFFPFDGHVMRSVLDGLKMIGTSRTIRVASFGKCTPVFEAEPWLVGDEARASGLRIFESKVESGGNG